MYNSPTNDVSPRWSTATVTLKSGSEFRVNGRANELTGLVEAFERYLHDGRETGQVVAGFSSKNQSLTLDISEVACITLSI